jgi:hypothetical protein
MKKYSIKLKRATNEKWVTIHASSEANARYQVEKANPGWTVTDIKPG